MVLLLLADGSAVTHPQPPLLPAVCTIHQESTAPSHHLPPATSKGPFFFRSSRTASTNSLPPFFSSVLPRQGQGRVRMPPRLRHRHSTSHVIAYFKWPEQLYFHKTAKQDLCLGWSGRETLERSALSQWPLGTTVLSGSLAARTLGVTQVGMPEMGRRQRLLLADGPGCMLPWV